MHILAPAPPGPGAGPGPTKIFVRDKLFFNILMPRMENYAFKIKPRRETCDMLATLGIDRPGTGASLVFIGQFSCHGI